MNVNVAAGVLIRTGRVLLCQRGAEREFPFTWECPGDSHQHPESNAYAIKRVFSDRLGMSVAVFGLLSQGHAMLHTNTHGDGGIRFDVSFYHVASICIPMPRPGVCMGWFSSTEMLNLPLAPAMPQALIDYVRSRA